MPHATLDVRNIALVGDQGAGKTLLAEALLFGSGTIRQKGTLARGSTVCDFDALEKKLVHSLDVSFCHFESGGSTVNLADTPGYADFAARSLTALEAVETAAVVVSAVDGVGPMGKKMMEFARQRGLCRLVIVNKIDRREARVAEVLAEIRDLFGKECLPLNLPARSGAGVVDCFFEPASEDTLVSSVEAAHKEIVEQIVEVDEVLMAKYLEQGESLAPDQLHDPFEVALRDGHLIPVCFASAETGAGIDQLLRIFARLMPNPTEGNPPPFLRAAPGESATPAAVSPDPAKHVLAHIFKIVADPFVGKLGFARVHQGTLHAGAQLYVGDSKKPIKVSRLYRMQGKEREEVSTALPGDIIAVPKVEELHFDAVLHDSHDEDHYHLEPVPMPLAMFGVAIAVERSTDEQKLSDALHRVLAEDPSVRVEHVGRETVLYGFGDLHLRVLLERMTERAGIMLAARPPSIPYRETITRKADGHHRHRKQTGGAGQFGEVFLRIAPRERGAGFEFKDEVVGGAIPFQFIPAVEKGVKRAMAEGAIAGYPICDVSVTVYDGKSHAVDSKEVAFVAAGRKAMLEAVGKAGAVVLEPVVRLESIVPASAIGAVTGDLSSRRGRITANEQIVHGRATVVALVPLSEVNDYASRLKSMTGGDGTYSMALAHYEPVPPRRQQELCASYRVTEDTDD